MKNLHLLPLLFACLCSQCVIMPLHAESDRKALALLKGVEQRLSKYNSFRVEYTIHYEADDRMASGQPYDHFFATDFHKNNGITYNFTYSKRAIDDREEYALRIGNDVYLHTEGDPSVRLDDLVKVEPYPVFDPHVRFMTDLCYADETIKDVVLYHFPVRDNWTVHQDVHNGMQLWVVRCVEKIEDLDAIHELWIEEPSFRVHKHTYSISHLKILVENYFDGKDLALFPSSTKIYRTNEGKTSCNRTIRYTTFKETNTFPQETFTLQSFNLPLNAAIHDSRLKRRLGYWNGEELVNEPVWISAQEHREVMKQMEEDATRRKWLSIGGLIGIGIGAVLVLGAIYLMIR